MVNYSTSWNILDKNKKVIDAQKGRACFASLVGARAFPDAAQYLEYDFSNYDTSLSIKDMYKYFLFLKSIPEFALGMPYDVLEMAETQKLRVDITKLNGIQLFSLLTVVRAVREDPAIVQDVLRFDPTVEYSWTKLGILKACGSIHHHNSGHWLTSRISVSNVNKSPTDKKAWDNKATAKETGLIRAVNESFQFSGDGFAPINPIKVSHVDAVLKETEPVPVVKKETKKKIKQLIVDF